MFASKEAGARKHGLFVGAYQLILASPDGGALCSLRPLASLPQFLKAGPLLGVGGDEAAAGHKQVGAV